MDAEDKTRRQALAHYELLLEEARQSPYFPDIGVKYYYRKVGEKLNVSPDRAYRLLRNKKRQR